MRVINDPVKCAVKIEHTQEDGRLVSELPTIEFTCIQRRKKGEAEWRDIYKATYYGSGSLDFTTYDYTVSSHQTYEYRNVYYLKEQATDSTSLVEGESVSVYAQFDGFLIADEHNVYVSLADPKYTYQKDFNIAFVKPYNSKYPHAVRNGDACSCSGTFEGDFNPLDANCQFEKQYAAFENEITEFLYRPTSKMFKTFDGHVWYIHINTPIKKVDDQIGGFIKLQFSWNEIGKLPDNFNEVIARVAE